TGIAHSNSIKAGLDLGHEQWIMSAASRNDELTEFCYRPDKMVESIQNRQRRQNRSGANEIFGVCFPRLGVRKQVTQVFFAVLLASGRFRGLFGKIFVPQERLKQS